MANFKSQVCYVVLIAMSVVQNAYAGFYGGVQLGLSRINQDSFNSGQVLPDTRDLFNPRTNFTIGGVNYSALSVLSQAVTTFSTTQENNAYMINVFYGYSFLRYAALEMGFIAAAPFKNSYKATTNTTLTGIATAGVSGPFTQTFPMNVKRDDRSELFALDIAYKASVPLTPYFDVFAKIGYALYWQRLDSKITGNIPNQPASFRSETKSTQRRTAPLLALGASYYYNEYSSFDFTWTRLIPHILEKDADQSIDLYGLGFTLRFCTNYC